MHTQPDIHLPKEPKIKVYTALLTQVGTNAPTATILQNTLGEIVWTRNGAGNYEGTTYIYGLPIERTSLEIGQNSIAGYNIIFHLETLDENSLRIGTHSADDELYKTLVTIKVYNL